MLAQLLEDNRIACWVEDEDDLSVRHATPDLAESDVWVEAVNVERAHGVLAQWELGRADRVAGAVARVRLVLGGSFVVPALYVAATWISSEDLTSISIPLVFVLWIVSAIALGFYENHRFVTERISRPPGLGR